MTLSRYVGPLVRVLSLRWLLAPFILLAAVNCITLFAHSDVDIPLLWSQCHARERLPALSYVPLLGTPTCFLLSFYQVALDSWRSRADMCVLLSFLGALATVCWLESTRAWNASYAVIKRPTLPWLAFSLLGGAGAVVWHLLIGPAFVHRAKTLSVAADDDDDDDDGDGPDSAALHGEAGRMLPDSDIVAVPVAVALGFFLPSALMIFLRTPVAIAVWLFFPLYITLIQGGVRAAVHRFQRSGPTLVLLERHWQAIALVYLLPVVLSLLSNAFFWWHWATRADDRRKMTLLTASFVEINITSVSVTVLYWMFVEAGWKLPVLVVVVSHLLGPGGGLCLGWLYRESLIRHGLGHVGADRAGEADGEAGVGNEDTPLLR